MTFYQQKTDAPENPFPARVEGIQWGGAAIEASPIIDRLLEIENVTASYRCRLDENENCTGIAADHEIYVTAYHVDADDEDQHAHLKAGGWAVFNTEAAGQPQMGILPDALFQQVYEKVS